MSDTSVPALVPARMINEALFCERLLYLEWAQGEFAHNFFTADGAAVHRRVDKPSGDLASIEVKSAKPYTARSVWLSSDELGITSKIDFVEGTGKCVTPVEYKRGKAPDLPEGAYLPERAQLCAQVLLLREHGYTVDQADIYFAESNRRVPIVIDALLIEQTQKAAARAREVCASKHAPPPLVASPKCSGCSLSGICLPDEINALSRAPAATPKDTAVRCGAPERDTAMSLHVQEQGAHIGLGGENLLIRSKRGTETAHLVQTSNVCVYGSVQVSTQALRECLQRNIPVAFFTTGGWYCGRTQHMDSKNIDIKIAQFRAFSSGGLALSLARRIVEAKIKNCRTLLRRNANEGMSDYDLRSLYVAAERATNAASLESLLGIEGMAAHVYFENFSAMLRHSGKEFWFESRNRRPPRDPVNALLSLAYSLLVKDFSLACATVGLEPLYGFYHQPRFGRPSLALDLMEEFRPLLADSTVLSVLNTGEISVEDFVKSGDAVALTAPARKKFIHAYERRLDQLVTHPTFNYRLSYRRVIELQARLFTKVLLGELPEYPQFVTR